MVASASLAGWWWSYKGKVDRDFLLEQLFAVRALDSSVRFFESGVFDEDVSLQRSA
jgi:hypothetical protein